MTQEEHDMLKRINDYAEQVMPDIDPQKVQISVQLEKLKPIMETIAKETGKDLSEVFIKYMDLASEAACKSDDKMRNALQDLNDGEDGAPPLLYR
jgi:hypothetical protein